MVSREQIKSRIQQNERAIERARRVREEINWTIRDSNRRMQRIEADLRRAGLLRD